jgi:hypothetical protein
MSCYISKDYEFYKELQKSIILFEFSDFLYANLAHVDVVTFTGWWVRNEFFSWDDCKQTSYEHFFCWILLIRFHFQNINNLVAQDLLKMTSRVITDSNPLAQKRKVWAVTEKTRSHYQN